MPRKAKHPDQLTGHSHGRAGAAGDRKASMTKFVRDPDPQPSLNSILGRVNPMTGESWCQATMKLWKELETFPTTQNLQLAQWMLLARAVAIDDASLSDPKLAPEARIRLGQFGVTPDELLKMRVAIVTADEAERRGRPPEGGGAPQQSSAQRYGPHLSAVPS